MADYAIRAFNAVGGFNTVLYAMGAIMAGKTLMSVIAPRFVDHLDGADVRHPGDCGANCCRSNRQGVRACWFGADSRGGDSRVVIANWDRIWPALKAGASAAADFIGAVWDTVVPKFQAVFGSLLSIAKAFFQGRHQRSAERV